MYLLLDGSYPPLSGRCGGSHDGKYMARATWAVASAINSALRRDDAIVISVKVLIFFFLFLDLKISFAVYE